MYVFHREPTSEAQATYRSCFPIPVELTLLLLGSFNKCNVHQSSLFIFTKWNVHQSSLLRFIKCIIHQSPVLRLPRVLCQSTLLHLLQVHHSPISSVTPSTSVVPIDTVELLQLHRSTLLLHLLAAILCHMIMLLDDSILSIILLPMWTRLVDYLTASLKS